MLIIRRCRRCRAMTDHHVELAPRLSWRWIWAAPIVWAFVAGNNKQAARFNPDGLGEVIDLSQLIATNWLRVRVAQNHESGDIVSTPCRPRISAPTPFAGRLRETEVTPSISLTRDCSPA